MSITPKIKVLIADDHAMVRQGLTVLLENFDEFEVVGAADNAQMALTMCHYYQPHVILMDLMMPGMSSVKAIGLIRKQHPSVNVVIVSSSVDEILIQEALRAGAMSYLSKNGSIDEVAESVRQAYQGQSHLDPLAIHALLSFQQKPVSKAEYLLTQRQRDVLTLMIDGLNNRQIGEQLCISVSTVKNHVMGIFAKFKVDNRSKAVAFTLQNKILEEG